MLSRARPEKFKYIIHAKQSKAGNCFKIQNQGLKLIAEHLKLYTGATNIWGVELRGLTKIRWCEYFKFIWKSWSKH